MPKRLPSDAAFGMVPRMKPNVAALCVSGRSIYKHLPGVDAYDEARDARSVPGGMPVVAHPPCRTWSLYRRACAKPLDLESEQDLGRWCVDQVIRHGGVLEQPAHSLLWAACNLPLPTDLRDVFCWTLYLEQGWFGCPTPKPTWLLICGVPPQQVPPPPFSFEPAPSLKGSLSKAARSRTPNDLALWLVGIARSAWYRSA